MCSTIVRTVNTIIAMHCCRWPQVTVNFANAQNCTFKQRSRISNCKSQWGSRICQSLLLTKACLSCIRSKMVKLESQNIAKGTTDLGDGCFYLIECSTQWKTFVQTFVSSSHNLANIYFWNQLWIATHETDIRTKPTHCKVEIFRQSEALQFNSRSRSFIMLPNLGQNLLGLIWQRGEKYIKKYITCNCFKKYLLQLWIFFYKGLASYC